MARASEGIPNLKLRGRVGQVVFIGQSDGSTAVRQLPSNLPPRTALQEEVADRMRTVAAAWQALSFEEADAWQKYVSNPHLVLPQGGGSVPKTAYNAFSGLSLKCLQMRPTTPVPTLPPTSAFLGDGLIVVVDSPSPDGSFGRGGRGERTGAHRPPPPSTWQATPTEPGETALASPASADPPSSKTSHLEEGVLTFSPSAPNTPGVLTEILVQKLAGKHRKPVAKAYRTAAFVAFTNAPFELAAQPGVYACAIRFVREATGQETQTVPIGVVQVSPGASA